MSDKTSPQNSPPLKRRGSRHASPEVRKKQILDAAIQCISNDGFHNVTTESIAKVSGLSKGSLYRFFKSKEELLVAIMEDWEQTFYEKLKTRPSPQPLIQKLYDYCFLHLEIAAERPNLLPIWSEFLLHPMTKEGIKQAHLTSRKELASIIREGIKSGEFNDVSPTAYADTIISLFEGIMVIATANSDVNFRKRADAMWLIIKSGLVKQ